jgi:hypothetical protein
MALMILKQQMGEEEVGRRPREMIVQVAVILVIRFLQIFSWCSSREKLTSDPVIYS